MRTPSKDTLKLGTTAALLGVASLVGWTGLAMSLAGHVGERFPPHQAASYWADMTAMSAATLLVTGIAGLLVWVLVDQPRIDA